MGAHLLAVLHEVACLRFVVGDGLDLSEGEGLLLLSDGLGLCIRVELSETFFHVLWDVVVDDRLSVRGDYLGQVDSLLLHDVLQAMKLVPEFPLDFAHVRPGVHPIGLNI